MLSLRDDVIDPLELRGADGHGRRIEIVAGATHLFEEPGALERVAALACLWFRDWLQASATAPGAHV